MLQPPAGYSGVGEPNVHFYDNKALLTFNDDRGNIFTSSSTDGVNWSTPQVVTSQPGAYGVFQSPLSAGNSVDASISLWNPYGHNWSPSRTPIRKGWAATDDQAYPH